MSLSDLGRGIRHATVVGLLIMLGACGGLGRNAIVVLPDESGHVGTVVVGEGDKAQVLDSAYAAADVSGSGDLTKQTATAEAVQRAFGAAFAARPIPPRRYTLFFKLATDELTAESDSALTTLFADIKARPTYEVEVVGHTDTLHSHEANQALSQQRAEHVRTLLITRGIAADAISAAGRGELDLAVPTPDDTDEPRNRRVEATVR